MNKIIKGALVTLAALALAGCGSVFHNGTQMYLGKVEVRNLPSTPYADGTVLVFSQCYNIAADTWIHNDAVKIADPYYQGTVSSGTVTFNFVPPLKVEESQLKFLIIDPLKNWAVYHAASKAASDSGNADVILDNTWQGTSSAGITLVGVVQDTADKDIYWNFE